MNTVLFGDCRDTMRDLIAQGVRVQMCVTSPPYFGLRDYGHPGQIGLEATPAEFVRAMVEVFALVRELLADDGVLWLNLGDSYAGTGKSGGGAQGKRWDECGMDTEGPRGGKWMPPLPGMRPKNLIGIPWRVAFALQEAGWNLRQDIIWHKPNPMPESVTDRCTKAHEYLFLLSKSERYYWNAEAMKEQAAGALPGNQNHKHTAEYEDSGDEKHRTKAGLVDYAKRQRSKRDSFKREDSKRAEVIPGQTVGTHRPDRDESEWDTATRNRRSVWTVPTQPYTGAHFATFPPALIEPCILAGSRSGDTVLDPFFGSGTTGEVAGNLGRNWIGCEINEGYAPLQRERTAQAGLAL
ncbi:MAG TPA: site-specific DNA-methyltransferase [Rhodocyclaceae bacterium]|nr:site-specific DNA-methyltransferase [Rhodocyclaceae bacterium]